MLIHLLQDDPFQTVFIFSNFVCNVGTFLVQDVLFQIFIFSNVFVILVHFFLGPFQNVFIFSNLFVMS